MGTEFSPQTLRQKTFDHRGDKIWLCAHIDESTDRANGIVGVNCREDEVASECRSNSDVGCLSVTNLTDEDHFRVLSERKRLLQENRLLREDLKTLYKFDNLVGSSPKMQRVYSTIQSVSRMRSTG